MPRTTYTLTNQGLNASLVRVEATIRPGLPITTIIGLPSKEVCEARDRLRSIIKTHKQKPIKGRLTINLSPGNIRKHGTHFDLAIAIATIFYHDKIIQEELNDYIFLGELSLSGHLVASPSILPLFTNKHILRGKTIFIPQDTSPILEEFGGCKVLEVSTIKEVIDHITGKHLKTKKDKHKKKHQKPKSCHFWEQISEEGGTKRVLQIAAAGRHHMLLIGPPGSGKTLLAGALGELMPSLKGSQILTKHQILALSGKYDHTEAKNTLAPIRKIHPSITEKGLIGGGRPLRPGEISLAHNGLLILDEFCLFKQRTLDFLRGPIESHTIEISRGSEKYQFPCKFQLVGTTNPCPCGYHAAKNTKDCTCHKSSIKSYRTKLENPLSERIDIKLDVGYIKAKSLFSRKTSSFKDAYANVKRARRQQYIRQGKLNGDLSPKELKTTIKLSTTVKDMLEISHNNLGLSHRKTHQIIRLSQTIADIEGAPQITTSHLAEAFYLSGVKN